MNDERASDQHHKELSIATTASSMINASEMISDEAYQANLRRIQEVKEMVRRLEVNNESAHNNFLVDQLEKRAKDGREAEIMLAQLRNPPGPSQSIQFTNNTPSASSAVILPTTATLVEVPELHSSSNSTPGPQAATSPPQTIQQGRPNQHQWNLATQVQQVQPHNPNITPYYAPQPTVPHPQFRAAPRSQAPAGWYTTQNGPPQSKVHNQPVHQPGFPPIQVQQSPRYWNSRVPLATALPTTNTVPAQGYYASQSGWIKAGPVHSGPSAGSSSATYQSVFPAKPNGSQPPVIAHNQSQSLPSLTSTSRAQVGIHGVPVPSVKVSSTQPPPPRFHPQLVESQSQSLSVAVSKPVATPEIQRPHQISQQSQPRQLQQQRQPRTQTLTQQLSQPLPPLQQHSQPTQPQFQRSTQPSIPSQQDPWQALELQSQRAHQPPQIHLQPLPQSVVRAPSTSVARLQSQPSQARDPLPIDTLGGTSQTLPPQFDTAQEQAQRRGTQFSMDQTKFTELFKVALQHGVLQFKTFLFRARASGISDEWFRVAFNSLPRDMRESLAAQIHQSSTIDVSSATIPQQQVSAAPGPKAPVSNVPPSPTATPLVEVLLASTNPPIPEQASEVYAAHVQYYAEQATKSSLSASLSTPCSSNTIIQEMASTPKRDLSQSRDGVQVTPQGANKKTLARDVLWSLMKGGETMKSKPTGGVSNHEPPEVDAPPRVSHLASSKPPVVPSGTNSVLASASLIPPAEPNIPAESPSVGLSNLSATRSVSNGEATVKETPIMIDLTLEDSDKSVGGNGQKPFPIQTSTSAAVSSQPISPTNTTSHIPLLENLSLEEPPIDVAVDCNNADVRMYSPPLSQAAEENMGPGHLRSPPGSAGFQPRPHEANEQLPDGHLPLFLPSPPGSPPTEPPETDLEMTNDEGKSWPSLKRHSVDVDEVEIDTALRLPRIRKRPKQRVYVLIPPAPPYVKRAIKKMKRRATIKDMESDSEGAGDDDDNDDEIQYSHIEQLLIEESKSQLLERRCRWLSCSAVLNCAVNLLAHLKKHAREDDSQVLKAPFICRWASCHRRFDMEQEYNVHLEKHTIRPLPCPFAGCDEQFNKPVEVMLHEVEHQKVESREFLVRKRTHEPVVPAIPARLGPPPHRLPSHRVIPRRVVKCRISADRHATMGPWILWNIFSPVELNARKQNASMRGRQARQVINYDMDGSEPRRDDYDFLLALSSYPAKNPQLDDLDSSLITMSAARGLTLWGSGAAVKIATETATPEEGREVGAAAATSSAEELPVTSEGKLGGSEDGDVARDVDEERWQQGRQSVGFGEEASVERMLDVALL